MYDTQCFTVRIVLMDLYRVYYQRFIGLLFQAWHLPLFLQDDLRWSTEL